MRYRGRQQDWFRHLRERAVVQREALLSFCLQPGIDHCNFLFLRRDDVLRQLLDLRVLAIGEIDLGHVDGKPILKVATAPEPNATSPLRIATISANATLNVPEAVDVIETRSMAAPLMVGSIPNIISAVCHAERARRLQGCEARYIVETRPIRYCTPNLMKR